MKKKFVSLLAFCALTALTASAQNVIVVGDMNGDGQLTVGDVASLTETVIGKSPRRTITSMCDANASDPAVIAGEWRTVNKQFLALSADGKAVCLEWPTVTHFEYYPYARLLVLLNDRDEIVKHFTVLRHSSNRLDVDFASRSYYANDDLFATDFVITPASLTLKTGEKQQLSITAALEGALIPEFQWTSKNTDIATVTTTGLLTAVKAGTATIVASGGGKELEYTLDVVQPVESITLSHSEVTIDKGKILKLTATVLPEDASDRTFTWTSSNHEVAEVITTGGNVVANDYGTCTITATANDGSGVKAECVIVVGKNYEYVDLGLPSGTLWATRNVGADTPEDYGYYFAWGEVEPKSSYDLSTYKYFNNHFTKYCFDGEEEYVDKKDELDLEDDAAYRNWGEGWRMPSYDQLNELKTICAWTWDSTKKGYTVVGPNKNSLFFPAAGYYNASSPSDVGSRCFYWSRHNNAGDFYYLEGSRMGSFNNYITISSERRFNGMPVRAVRQK